MIIKSIILVLIFYYFFRLSSTTTSKGVNHLIIFFTFYNLIKYSFIQVQDNIVALWIDGALIGFCLPIILTCLKRKQIPNQLLLIKIIILIFYGIILLLITFPLNGLSLIESLDRLRDYMLFPILTFTVFIVSIQNIDNAEKIFRTVTIVCGIGVLFFICEYIYINALHHHPAESFWVRNRYGPATSNNWYSLELKPQVYIMNYVLYRTPGIFVQSHQSAHFMVFSFISIYTQLIYIEKNNNYNKFLLRLFCILIFISIVLSFIKMAIMMLLFYLLFLGNKYLTYKTYIKKLILLFIASLSLIIFPIFDSLKALYTFILDYLYLSKNDSINQYIDKNNLITFFTGNGFIDSDIAYKGLLSGDDFFIFFLVDQIGFLGIALFLMIIIPPLFYSFSNLKFLKNIVFIEKSMKAIIIVGLISTLHYSTLLSYANQAIFYTAVGVLYALKRWDKIYNYQLTNKLI